MTDYLILVSEDAPDRDPRGKCTVAWVVHTQLHTEPPYALAEARRIYRVLGRPVMLVEAASTVIMPGESNDGL
jgi:hypothetical protein